MADYDGAVAAYRETTKWLAAFMPITAIATAAVTIAPDLGRTFETTVSLGDWWSSYWLLAICCLAIVVSVIAVLSLGARVLSSSPETLSELQKPANSARLATAFGAGIAAPDFLDKADFDRHMAAWQAANTADPVAAANDASLPRLRSAVAAIRAWSLFEQVRGRFASFQKVFVASAFAIIAALAIAPTQIPTLMTIDGPSAVEVTLSPRGILAVKADVDCQDPSTAKYIAVGGSWEFPVLSVDGTDCAFDARWEPEPGEAEVRKVFD